jgi:hypothetical protein
MCIQLQYFFDQYDSNDTLLKEVMLRNTTQYLILNSHISQNFFEKVVKFNKELRLKYS